MNISLALTCCLALQPAVLYVSPGGSVSGDGTRSKPLATLAKALEVAEQRSVKTIELMPGSHLVEGVTIGPSATGMTIQGSDPAKSVVSGGPLLTKWSRRVDGIWSHPWPSSRPVRCLTNKGGLIPRARFPHTGRFQHESSFPVRWMSTTGGGWERKPTAAELTTMTVQPNQLPAGFKVENAEVTVYHMWDESTIGVKSYDPATRRMVFSGELGHPPGAFDVKSYVVWNTEEGLAKGTWMHDRSKGEILYWPRQGEEPKLGSELRTSSAEYALKIKDAQDVTIKNLSFTAAGTPLKSGGFGALNYEGALTADSARNLTLSRVSVQGTGGWGIRTWNCEGLKVERCRVRNCGAGGIRAEGPKTVVSDTTIQNTGLCYPSAPGLFVQGPGSSALHNLITDSTYSGIIGGSDDQIIQGNRIRKVMTVMHDGAAVYAGFAKRMVYRGNWVSDIEDTGGYGASAYYLDEGATDCLVEGNLSEGVLRPSQNHMASNCTIKGNLFLIPGNGRLEFARCSGFKLEGNLIEAKGSLTFRFPEGGVSFGRSLLSSSTSDFRLETIEPGGYSNLMSGPLPSLPGVLRGPLGLSLKKPGSYQAGATGLAKSAGLPIPDVRTAGPRPEKPAPGRAGQKGG